MILSSLHKMYLKFFVYFLADDVAGFAESVASLQQQLNIIDQTVTSEIAQRSIDLKTLKQYLLICD